MAWVFLLQDSLTGINRRKKDCNLDIVSLKHPGTGNKNFFIFNSQNEVQEILSFTEPKRSWFINETVVSNGNLYLSTPMDPLFLILPYLEQCCSSQASPLDQIIKDPNFPASDRILKCCSAEQLSLVADRRGSHELNAYKFNKQKCLAWLTKKIELIIKVLKDKKLHVDGGAVSVSYVKSEADNTATEDDYKLYAFGIVAEYISIELCKALKTHLNLPDDTENQKRKSISSIDKNSKKIKLEPDYEDIENKYVMPIKMEKVKVPSAKEKAWEKAASGTKSISSFFKRK